MKVAWRRSLQCIDVEEDSGLCPLIVAAISCVSVRKAILFKRIHGYRESVDSSERRLGDVYRLLCDANSGCYRRRISNTLTVFHAVNGNTSIDQRTSQSVATQRLR